MERAPEVSSRGLWGQMTRDKSPNLSSHRFLVYSVELIMFPISQATEQLPKRSPASFLLSRNKTTSLRSPLAPAFHPSVDTKPELKNFKNENQGHRKRMEEAEKSPLFLLLPRQCPWRGVAGKEWNRKLQAGFLSSL